MSYFGCITIITLTIHSGGLRCPVYNSVHYGRCFGETLCLHLLGESNEGKDVCSLVSRYNICTVQFVSDLIF